MDDIVIVSAVRTAIGRFGGTLKDMPAAKIGAVAIKEAVTIGQRSEAISIAAINDRADMNQVVTAVAEAEVTLRTVVSVRDKVVEAYREILRMPV